MAVVLGLDAVLLRGAAGSPGADQAASAYGNAGSGGSVRPLFPLRWGDRIRGTGGIARQSGIPAGG